jgi:hypothetical protein
MCTVAKRKEGDFFVGCKSAWSRAREALAEMGFEGLSSLPAHHSRVILIVKMAWAIVEAWSPEGIDGKTLASGLGLAPKNGGTVSSTSGPAASN